MSASIQTTGSGCIAAGNPSHLKINSKPLEPKINKILIIQTAFIGDVVLTTPLARATKQSFANSKVHFLVIPSTSNVLENNPYIDQLMVYDKRGKERGFRHILKLAWKLTRERYDLALLPHRSFRSALIAFLAHIPRRLGFDTSAAPFLLTQRIPYQRDLHEVERNLTLLKPFQVNPIHKQPEIYPDEKDRQVVDHFFDHQGINQNYDLIALAPGSIWPTKRWPEERYAQLAQKLIEQSSSTVILVGSKQDQTLCQWIAGQTKGPIYNAAGEFTLRQSAELLRRCRLLVSNDSAPMHLAVAIGTRVVAIFGPTVPGFGFYPYGPGHVVIEKELACRPCGLHGGTRCPSGSFQCMKGISVEEVFQVIKELV
ncbi:MAG: lipopolysaccharide heptosyltransferase II [candidate division KSB1 bacterium]|nr:lipopolysaccharide heptosyltransferase II [candidate division KSB1 bacterium]